MRAYIVLIISFFCLAVTVLTDTTISINTALPPGRDTSEGIVDISTTTPHVPANVTTPSANTTTPSANTTTPSANTTTPSANTTTLSANTTTASANTTTPSANTTTPYVTTRTANSTTANVTTRTTSGNMTTSKVPVTTHNTISTRMPSTTQVTPDVPHFSWSSGGVVCIVGQMNAKFKISYAVKSSKTNSSVDISIPDNVRVIYGVCGAVYNQITLEFHDTNITIEFEKNTKKQLMRAVGNSSIGEAYHVSRISLIGSYGNAHFFKDALHPNATLFVADSKDRYTITDSNLYYNCKSAQSESWRQDVYVTLSDMKLQAFRTSKNDSFTGKPDTCESDKPKPNNNVIPIVVGCVLAGLVVIILIAYLVIRYRHRHRLSGYQSV